MNEITYTITRELAVLLEHDKGCRLELNEVSWNGAAPKLDIRRLQWHRHQQAPGDHQ